jgi:hypothetical protein
MPADMPPTENGDYVMKAFREKFVRIFIAIRVVSIVASIGLHAVKAVEIVQGKTSMPNLAWLMKAVQTPPAR